MAQIAIVALVSSLLGCKRDGPAGPVYSLTIETTTGVTGTPVPGVVTSGEGETVTYEFSARAGFDNLAVVLNGVRMPPVGIIRMDRDHFLYAEADSIRVPNVVQSTAIAATRTVLTSSDPVGAATGLLNTMNTMDRGSSATASALERMAVSSMAFDRARDSEALARVDAALAGKLFDLDFGDNLVSQAESNATEGLMPVTFLYVNGILNSYDDALSGVITAKRLIEEIGLPSYGSPRYKTKLAYVATAAEPGYETSLCHFRAASDATARHLPVIRWFYIATEAFCGVVLDLARSLNEIQGLMLNGLGNTQVGVIAESIRAERSSGRAVVVIGHSRGTLVSQLALRQYFGSATALDSDRQKCVGLVSLASPFPDQVPLRNLRNLYAEGTTTRDLMLHLPRFGTVRPHGFRTNLTDKTDAEFAKPRLLFGDVAIGIKKGYTLHAVIPSYLLDTVMRDSVKRAIQRQVATIQSDCAPAATSLTVSNQPTDGISGDIVNPHPVVSLRDHDGFVVGSTSATVTASLLGLGGSLAGTRTVNASNGVAVFSDLRITGSGTFRLNFASAGLPSVTSSAFTIAPASCSGIPVSLPFSRTGVINSTSCLVSNRRAQPYRFDVGAQGVTVLSTNAPAFSPFIKVADAAGRGNYRVWTSGNSMTLRWLLSQGTYMGAIGTNTGQIGSFTFGGTTGNENAGTCAVTFLLQPGLLQSDQSLSSGDCSQNGRILDVFSIGSASSCVVTVQSSAFHPVIEIYDRNDVRIAVNNAGSSSQARVSLPRCYAESDNEFIFGLHVHVFSVDSSRLGEYRIAFEFDQSSASREEDEPVLLMGTEDRLTAAENPFRR